MIQELTEELQQGVRSVDDVLRETAHRISYWEPTVKAFLHLDPDFMAGRLVPQNPHLPLHGVSVAVKDLFEVTRMPLTGGSDAYYSISTQDAPVISQLREAGAFVVGKTNTQELAYGVVTEPTRNPWNTEYIPGGSSGGSAAAVAAGMSLLGMGTDTGGSVRIPAAITGTVGFKPTYGLLDTDGIMPLSPSLDHVGLIVPEVADAIRVFRILIGDDHEDSGPPGPRRIVVPWDYLDGVLTGPVQDRFLEVIQLFNAHGCELAPIEMNPWEWWKDLQLTIRLPEAYRIHRDVLEGKKRKLLKGDLAARLDPGNTIRAVQYLEAKEIQQTLKKEWQARMKGFDCLLLPTMAVTTPRVGQETVDTPQGNKPVWDALVQLTAPWNVLGFPAISLPAGLDADGMPLGMQLIGNPGEDLRLLHGAMTVERWLGPLNTMPLPGYRG